MTGFPVSKSPAPMTKWLLLFATSTLLLLLVCSWMGWCLLRLPVQEVDHVPLDLEGEEIMMRARGLYDMFSPVPDPKIDMTFFPNMKEQRAWKTNVTLFTNSSGFRFPREFAEKKEGTFRVVLLGDSYVVGAGSPFEHSLSPQLEAMLNRALIPEKLTQSKIEVYPLGVGGWNIFSEVAFLIHNMHIIKPDLVIHCLCQNDMDSGYGFILGHVRSNTYDAQSMFGPTRMSVSSPSLAFRSSKQGKPVYGLIGSYLIPESKSRFKAAAWQAQRLRKLLRQHCDAGYLLFLFKSHIAYGVKETFANFMKMDEIIFCPEEIKRNNLLPLDPHPNKEGYRYVALALAQYLRTRHLLPLDEDALSREGAYDPFETLETKPGLGTREAIELLLMTEKIPRFLKVTEKGLQPEEGMRAVVGGLWRGGILSIRTVLVLSRGQECTKLRFELLFPPHPALDGGMMTILINGKRRSVIKMESVDGETTKHALSLEKSDLGDELVEIVLQADTYFTEMSHTYKNGVFGYAPLCGKLISVTLEQ